MSNDSSPPVSLDRKLRMPPLVLVRARSRSPPTEASSNALSGLILSSDIVEKGTLDKVDIKKQTFSILGWRSLFRRQVHSLLHKSIGPHHENNEKFDNPSPLDVHPLPEHPIQSSALDPCPSLGNHDYSLQGDHDSPSLPSSPDSEYSDSPSLVSTPCSPSPQHYVTEALGLGIKVRDFAHEDHGVPLAPSIPDADQLKVSYCLYRTAGHAPPSGAIEKLKVHDAEWLTDVQRRFGNSPGRPKPMSKVTVRPRRGETEGWLDYNDDDEEKEGEALSFATTVESEGTLLDGRH